VRAGGLDAPDGPDEPDEPRDGGLDGVAVADQVTDTWAPSIDTTPLPPLLRWPGTLMVIDLLSPLPSWPEDGLTVNPDDGLADQDIEPPETESVTVALDSVLSRLMLAGVTVSCAAAWEWVPLLALGRTATVTVFCGPLPRVTAVRFPLLALSLATASAWPAPAAGEVRVDFLAGPWLRGAGAGAYGLGSGPPLACADEAAPGTYRLSTPLSWARLVPRLP
jgi:hypothetical protein